MNDPLEAIRETFFLECEEQLAALEAGLLAIQAGEAEPDTVNAVFRAVHSVKGGAGAFGLDRLVRFAHVFETALDGVRAGRLPIGAKLVAVMLRAADVLADLVRAARGLGKADPAREAALAEELGALSAGAEPPPAPGADMLDGLDFTPVAIDMGESAPEAAPPWRIVFRPHRGLFANGNEAATLLREVARLGEAEITLDAAGLPDFAALDPEDSYLGWNILLRTGRDEAAIREVFEFVEGDCDLSIAPDAPAPEPDAAGALLALVAGPSASPEPSAPPPPAAPPREAEAPAHAAGAPKTTIRVDLDRVDRLIDLVGELVINQAMLAQRVSEAGLPRSSDVALGLGDLEQLTREIQDSVMAIRAQPVKSVFQRMPRLVREVSSMTGKPARLITEGETTEVDKTVIEHLADPLTHMIRNAIDHGLEPPARRAEAGKPEEGTVRLSARHRSGRIVIEVADDGGGINRARVRDIAVERKLIAPDAALSDEDIDNLIFLPGFSTADAVSDISGRGVGMDVVKRSIQALGGRIGIASTPGRGSVFTMSLPLTLAVLDGMVVSVAGQTLVAPLTAVVETLQPRARDVFPLGEGARVIAIRGAYLPLVDVGFALGFRNDLLDPAEGVALLVEGEVTRAALLVDAIQGQRQVVIKSLEANYRRVPGIAAATILGDGRVALILDVDAVVAACRPHLPPAEAAARAHA